MRRAFRVAGITVGVVCIVAAIVLGTVLNLPGAARLAVDLGVGRAPFPVAVGSVRGTLRGPLVLDGIEVEYDGARVRIERLVIDWQPMRLARRSLVVDSLHVVGVAASVPENFPVRSSAPEEEVEAAAGPPAVPDLPVSLDVRALTVAVDSVVWAGRGEVRAARIDFSGSIDDFRLDLTLSGAGDPVQEATVQASARGGPDRYSLVATTRFVSADLPPVEARLDAWGSMTEIAIDSVRIDTQNGAAALRGEVSWYPEVAWSVLATAELLDVAPLTPDPENWPGSISFEAASDGRLVESGVVASVVLDELEGSLRGEALAGALSADVRLPLVILDTLDLRWGDVEVRGRGAVLDSADLDLFVRVPDLGQLLPGASGRVELNAALTGEPTRPTVAAGFTARAVRMDSLSMRDASGTVNASLAEPDAPMRVTARLSGIESGATLVDSVTLNIRGSQLRHTVTAGAWLPDLGLGLRAEGALDLPTGEDRAPSWAGRFDSLSVATARAGSWRLQEPATLFASADSVALTRACVRQGPTGACLRFDRNGTGDVAASVEVEDVPLAAFPVALPEGISLEGRIDGHVDVSLYAAGELRAAGAITTVGSVRAHEGDDTTRVHFDGEGVDFVVDEVGTRGSGHIELRTPDSDVPVLMSASAELPGLTSIDVDPDVQAVEAELRIDAGDLSFLGAFIPGFSDIAGRVLLDMALTGTPVRPRVLATVVAEGLRADSLQLTGAEASVDVDLREPDGSMRMDVVARSLRSGETSVDSVRVTVQGRQRAHDVALDTWLPDGEFGLRGRGRLDLPDTEGGPAWAGALDAVSVSTGVLGNWALERPAAVFASPDSVVLARACLRQGEGDACLALRRDSAGAVAASLALERIALTSLPIPLREGVTLTGQVDGRALVRIAADGGLRSTVSATTSGSMTVPAGAETARFDFDGEGFSLEVDSTGARATVGFELRPVPTGSPFVASASVRLPGLVSVSVDPDEPFEGQLDVDSEDLSFLSAFLPGAGEVEGRLRLDAGASGTLAAPRLRGRIELAEGRLTIPDAGLDVGEIHLSSEADPTGGIGLTGGARSADGDLRITGRIPVEPVSSDPARLRIEGERFRAVSTPEFRVDISPALDVTFNGALFEVAGEVGVPWARVDLVEVPPAAVAPSKDVVIVDEEPLTPPQVRARVRVLVGDDVRFDGLGFTSMIEGDLTVSESPGMPPSVLGELRFIDGRYRAYGQDLTIDPGRVVFTGPVEDARLDVTATRTAQDGTEAGLDVRGTVVEPEITLTSDPAMADADVLSYILYGQPLSAGDASQQGTVAGAAATLGANVLTTRLASQVGLDDARIEGTTQDQAQLFAGKYITPSVYVSYGVGLFRPSNTFRIKYLLNSNWALQAESGDANGGDVLYQIERGR